MGQLIINKYTLILIALTGVFTGCYYDNEEYLYGNSNTSCDTSAVSYTADIEPIISSKCLTCHGNASFNTSGGGIALEGYNNISSYLSANSTRFLGAVKHLSGYSPMPKSGTKLDDCSIAKIETWINNNYPNN
ncbi:MAG: hypothetical protein D6707_07605 [Bacteroidetes bacterium]|nr:MAG: hypothetical protein D6707_07605 [Bacteroidota bacterium]